jgi:hypothetical protein
MTCLQDGDLQQYLSEPVASATRKRVDAHLASCVTCRVALDRLTATNAHVDGLLSSLITDEFIVNADIALARVRRRIESPSRWFVSRPWWAISAAACAVVIALGLWAQTRSLSDRVALPIPATVALAGAEDPLPGSHDYLPIGPGGPMQMGIVIRVTLPPSALAAFGVTSSAATQADLLVGDDGFAHAIRLVR